MESNSKSPLYQSKEFKKLFNPFKNKSRSDFQNDNKFSENSHKLNFYESKEGQKSSRQEAENPFNTNYNQESFNFYGDILEEKESIDRVSNNLFNNTIRHFSNSFVLNSFNQNLKPVFVDSRLKNSSSQFGLLQSRSLHGIGKKSPVKVVPQPKKVSLVESDKKDGTFKFFDMPSQIQKTNPIPPILGIMHFVW
jgi:hypothetical protein